MVATERKFRSPLKYTVYLLNYP